MLIDRAALYAYFSIFGWLLAVGMGLPMPEEVPVVAGGVLVGFATPPDIKPEDYQAVVSGLCASPTGGFPGALPWGTLAEFSQPKWSAKAPSLRWWIMLPICILGVVTGDGLLYSMGRFFGTRLLDKPWARRLLPQERRRRVEENFHQYGVWVLLFARCLPAIRAPIFIMAGVTRVSFKKFLLADGLYAIPGVSLLFFLGYMFGNTFQDFILTVENRIVGPLKSAVILLVIVAIAAFLVYHFLRHPVASGDPKEMPVLGGPIAHKIEQHEQKVHPEKRVGSDGKPPEEGGAGPPAVGDSHVKQQGNGFHLAEQIAWQAAGDPCRLGHRDPGGEGFSVLPLGLRFPKY